VEILKNVSIDWLSKKWVFFISSWVLVALGVLGVIHNYRATGEGLVFGIDFSGGTIVQLKFQKMPDFNLLRKALEQESEKTPPIIQTYGKPDQNKVQVRMQRVFSGTDVRAGRQQLLGQLRKYFDPEHLNSSQADFNAVGSDAIAQYLLSADPDNLKNQNKTVQETDDYYHGMAQKLYDYRENNSDGLVNSLDDLKSVPGLSNSVVASLKQGFYAGSVEVKGLESIGAVVGSDLRRRAAYAVGFSFLGMLVYVGFRFKPIYGVAAVVALLHDVAITVGLFAVTGKEISLTVIAALLTLIGYSMNDTIVVFDRARENIRLLRKEPLVRILNLSINQTLSRTIMTSGMTFLAVFALFVFGGEVLNGFSFALTVGIIIGTYSSIGIASPIVEWWYRSVDQKSKQKTA
jgi:preprotein translocase subunit SecF